MESGIEEDVEEIVNGMGSGAEIDEREGGRKTATCCQSNPSSLPISFRINIV